MTILAAILFGVFVAYANGSNDNFKGVATLFGSGTTDYKRALAWGTATTFAGSLVALVLAQELLAAFSGKGLVPESVIAMKSFPLAVLLASALTVILATRLGFPISTTHAIMGSLIGAGWLASSGGVNLSTLESSFLAPLLLSPILAIAGTALLYPLARKLRTALQIEKKSCVCVGSEVVGPVPVGVAPEQAVAFYQMQSLPTLSVGNELSCQERYAGQVLGVSAEKALNTAHYLSGGLVSFSRGLNDTPKIAAMLLVGGTISHGFALVSVAVAMALGGLISARKVAETLSHRVTAMNPGQGFTANFVTGVIVLFASKLGLPVSTTHVSCGALFGIGTVTGKARWKTITGILVAWITTLPVAAILAGVIFIILRGIHP